MMKSYQKMSNFHYKTTYGYPFKGECYNHLHYGYDKLTREVLNVYDFKLWIETKFEHGEELIVKRVSENGKYSFIY